MLRRRGGRAGDGDEDGERVGYRRQATRRTGTLGALPPAVRLALEMAAHEESERRALEGELAELERAWREAEEIAAIADELLLPPATGERLEALRERSASRGSADHA